jgi:peptidylprolyl isomerase
MLLVGAASPALTPNQIVAAAPASVWKVIDPNDLLVMDLAGGRRVVIELAPAFAPVHVANIRALARAGWWDGASIVRVQDNYVVQWAGGGKNKPLPSGTTAHPAAEYDREKSGLAIRPLGYPDAYAPGTGFADGWPVAYDGSSTWLTHCYGMVGAGRDMPPDTGNGSELYAVIGQAPRHLDRNLAVVGRVLEGMPLLASLPRGTGDLGFYASPGERVPIQRVTIAADLPVAARPVYEVMRSDAPAFTAYLATRADRRDAFFVRPAGGVDLCNAPVPTRQGSAQAR